MKPENCWEYPNAPPEDCGCPMTPRELDNLLKKLRKEGELTEIQDRVVRSMSSVLGGLAKKEVAHNMGLTQWKVYNIRRDAVRIIAKLLEVPDEELMFAPLGLKRGKKMPKRNTRYPSKMKEEEANVQDLESPIPLRRGTG